MSVVYKYPLALGDTPLSLPIHAEPLTVRIQHGLPVLWAKVNSNPPLGVHQNWLVRVALTGHEYHDLDSFKYLSTFQMDEGHFIGHVFVRNEGRS
jgi:hypothetical protein